MNFRKITAAVLAAALALSMTACRDDYTKDGGQITTADLSELAAEAETTIAESEVETEPAPEKTETSRDNTNVTADSRLILDREGKLIEIPGEVKSIVSLSPAITEILTGLGAGGKIVAADMGSSGIPGITPNVCNINAENININALISLNVDVIFVSGDISYGNTNNTFSELRETGANVVYIPFANSIESIKLDIKFLAEYVSAEEAGEEMIAEIDKAVSDISGRAASVKRKVYFEHAPQSTYGTCGGGTFINEIIELTGAVNIFSSENGCFETTPEKILAAKPDVIISVVNYTGYEIDEVYTRNNWLDIPAVISGNIVQVDRNSVTRPSQNIVDGMYAVAGAIYPEIFTE